MTTIQFFYKLFELNIQKNSKLFTSFSTWTLPYSWSTISVIIIVIINDSRQRKPEFFLFPESGFGLLLSCGLAYLGISGVEAIWLNFFFFITLRLKTSSPSSLSSMSSLSKMSPRPSSESSSMAASSSSVSVVSVDL